MSHPPPPSFFLPFPRFWNFVIVLFCVIFAVIILFNLARPQTKRKNVIADLTAQAYGTVVLAFSVFIFWVVAMATYLHKQDSDMADPYCGFQVLLGLFGIVIFCCIGAASSKFRHVVGRKDKKRKRDFDDVIVNDDDDDLDLDDDDEEIDGRSVDARYNWVTIQF